MRILPPVPFSDQTQHVYIPEKEAWRVVVADSQDDEVTLQFARHSDTSLFIQYIGKAAPGTATSSATWQVQRLTYADPCFDTIEKIEWADANANYDNVWDNREVLTYG